MSRPPGQLERTPQSAVSFTLAASHAAAGEARRALAGAPDGVLARLSGDGLLLLTELVNNAVVHGSGSPFDEVSVEVWERSERVRVEVRDDGAGFTWRPPPDDPERVAGYGLVLVDAVADRWGIDTSTGRTCVWFEI